MLRIQDGAYCDDTGPRLPIGFHAGDLYSASSRDFDRVIRQAIAPGAAAGYQFHRGWWILCPHGAPSGSFWDGRDFSPWVQGWSKWTATVKGVLTETARHGMQAHLCAGGLDGATNAERREVFGALMDIVKEVERQQGTPVMCLGEVLNEARDTWGDGAPTRADLEPYARIMRDAFPDRLVALTAFTGHEDIDIMREFTPDWMKFVYGHWYRGGHIWDKLRHLFSLLRENRLRDLWWNGEGPGGGPRVSAIDNRQELESEGGMVQYCRTSSIFNQATCFFSSHGVILDGPMTEMDGFAETPAAIQRLEQWAPHLHRFGSFEHVRSAGRVADIANLPADVRIDQRISQSRKQAALVLHGPRQTVNVDLLPAGARATVLHPDMTESPFTRSMDIGSRGQVILMDW